MELILWILTFICVFFGITLVVPLVISLFFIFIFFYLTMEYPILNDNNILGLSVIFIMEILYISIAVARIISVSKK